MHALIAQPDLRAVVPVRFPVERENAAHEICPEKA
jgi:hypothetical protein